MNFDFPGAATNFSTWATIDQCTGSAQALSGHPACQTNATCGGGAQGHALHSAGRPALRQLRIAGNHQYRLGDVPERGPPLESAFDRVRLFVSRNSPSTFAAMVRLEDDDRVFPGAQMNIRSVLRAPTSRALAAIAFVIVNGAGVASATSYTITVDASNPTTGNPRFWAASVGTGTASLTLRPDLRRTTRSRTASSACSACAATASSVTTWGSTRGRALTIGRTSTSI